MIDEQEFAKRRERLAKKLSKNSVGILWSASYKTRSHDTQYPYRQDSNFYYLTGFKENNACLVFLKQDKEVKTILFVEPKDKLKELWNGKRLGTKEAKKMFHVDAVFPITDLEKKLKSSLKKSKNLYFDFALEEAKAKEIKKYAKDLDALQNIAPLVGAMRLIKSPSEIALIKQAIQITKEAHHQAMRIQKVDKKEYELQAEIEYIFKSKGAYSDAYTSIVACANGANTLHYVANDQVLADHALILIDAGCEYEYYASDITRTIPVNGKFSEAQKELYAMVLDVQLRIIAMIRPNILRSDLQKKSEKFLCQGMIQLGILEGDYKKLIKKQAHKKYYPHGIGHWMGLDVHDASPYKDDKGDEIPLKAGMVLTIEPAIYIDKDDISAPEKYRGIGIRIEDDILVTHDGFENLSFEIVKNIEEIEALFFTQQTFK